MPKLYEYFGLIVMFYANEHEPVHVHGKCQGRESKAEIIDHRRRLKRCPAGQPGFADAVAQSESRLRIGFINVWAATDSV